MAGGPTPKTQAEQPTVQEAETQTPQVVQSGQAEEAGLWAWVEAIWGWICSWFQTSENKTAPTSAQQPASAPSEPEEKTEENGEKKRVYER